MKRFRSSFSLSRNSSTDFTCFLGVLLHLSGFVTLAVMFACLSQLLVLLVLDESLALRLEPAILPPLLYDHVTFSAQRSVRAYTI